MTDAERRLLLIVARFINDMEEAFAEEFESSRTEGLRETILEVEAEQERLTRKTQADRFIGQGRIIRQENAGFVVNLIDTDEMHLLLREEILVRPLKPGTEGRLVLRDTGFLTAYHLFP